MLYLTLDNKTYAAKTYKWLVIKIRRDSIEPSQTKGEWIENVKKRIEALYHSKISKNYKKFILDLDALGFVKLIRCETCNNNVGACLQGYAISKKMTDCPGMMTKEIRKLKTRI